ncbi:putative Ig domain-containing protein [Methylorubrum extorquens]|uniref:Staphylococcus aureus surface protein A n=1 Tax=Methylorubrum extorquens (strain ATCC 14718 / DSM 1338 / JCM 2805 / NCIMB 9133 / AM1) TaxID=272630 RepID=C5B4W7_METEA|nr:putative Ig domain-containing protein [Methylorubrum extorquens]ACS43499.1 Hypothetical protein MexAM1_META2p0652 [Methylorubrum extorquens AM1]MCP1545412.1 alpha-tubulin suppressor-like RCC1 family protein [Methylorubrum extorquens]MCP1591364.1 alpha-tubulin suppressor-like RCC1 family protein [Methylorubrum extorquens]
MRHSFRSFVAVLMAVAQPLEATAQVAGPIYDFSPTGRYFRYRVEGVDVTGVNVLVRGPTEVVLTGAATSIETRVRGGAAPYVFDVASGVLPEGMTLNPSTGAASGGTTKAGRYIFTIRATDANGGTGTSLPYTIVVQNQKLEVSRSPSLSAPLGKAYSDKLGATGGRQPYTWAVAQGALPPGLVLDPATGALSGAPTSLGQHLFRAQVTDADGARALSTEYVLFVDDESLSLSGSAPAKGQVGANFAGRFAAAGGKSPYAYTLSGLPLPPGLALESDTGWIKGTPSAAGEYGGLRVRATDATARFVDSNYFSVSIVAALVASWSGTKAAVGTNYSSQVLRTGGRAPYAFSLASGTLPPGLTLRSSDGLITGAPSAAGTFGGLVVRVSDADGRVAHTPSFGIEVSNELTVVGLPSRIGTQGEPYSSSVAVGGGLKPYAFRLGAGTLPGGLTIDGSNGTISGVPASTGLTEGLKILVTDGTGRTTVSDAFSIEVRDRLFVSTASMPAYHSVNTDYAGTMTASGGARPYRFSIAGTLPTGLFLDAQSGRVLGTPKNTGTYGDLVATVRDAEGRVANSPKFAVTVSGPIAVQTPASYATVNMSFSSVVATTGGRGPFVYTSRSRLPDGLFLDPAYGIIHGTPTAIGTTPGIVIDVVDADGRTGSTPPFDFIVETPASVVEIPQRAKIVMGVDTHTSAPVVTGGTAPFTFALKGNVPSTLKIDPKTGAIGGITHDPAGVYYSSLRIVATDARGRSSESDPFAVLVVGPLAISYASTKLAFDLQNNFQRYPARIEGGCGDLRWDSSGYTPPDIGIDLYQGSIGVLRSLRFWDEGSFPNVVVTAQDACGVTATATVDIDVQDSQPNAMLNGPANINVPVGQIVRTSPVSTGGLASNRFALSGSTLPDFLSLDGTTGVISGTIPASTPSGTVWTFDLIVTDDFGRRAIVPRLKITAVTPPTLSYSNGGRLPFQTTTWNQHVPAVVGGCPVSSWQTTSGNLPQGINLGTNGTIQRDGGQMSAGTSSPVTITLLDTCNQTVSTDVTIDIRTGGVAATGPSQQGLVVGEASHTDAMTVTGFAPDAVYTLLGGPLPPGVALDANLRIAGTLSSSASPGTTYGTFVYRVTDSFGRTATTPAFALFAAAPPQIGYAASTSTSTGSTLSLRPNVSGGVTPYTYQLTGTLPAGLTFSTSSGNIEGSPTAAGSASNLTVRISDASGVTKTSNAFAISVANPLTVTGSPPNGKTGTAYSYTFSATGGQGGLTFSTQSTLPAGLSLSAGGVLSGTPTRAGTYPFVVSVSEASGRSSSLSVSLTVAQATTAGTWMSWGTGQLGDGLISSVSYVPRQASALQPSLSIAVTGDGTTACGIGADKRISCWGNNKWGKLGDGSDVTAPESRTSTVTPVMLSLYDNTWTHVVAGSNYFCALNASGSVYCWGPNGSGTGQSGIYSTPMLVGSGYVRLATSPVGRTTCGIKNDGYASCWGAIAGSSMSNVQSPRTVPSAGLDTWSRIAPGTSTICGIQTDRTLWCWGANASGELGKGYADGTSVYVPTKIGTKSDWAEVVNNGTSICALDTTGSGWCWGSNAEGQLGTGGSRGISAPTPVAGGHKWNKLVASGDGAICGINESNSLLCWGRNTTGQLGSLDTGNQFVPTVVAGPITNFSDVAVSSVTYALPADGGSSARTAGNLYSWGWSGGLGFRSTSDAPTPIVVGNKNDWVGTTGGLLFGCVSDVAGYGFCWGDNAYGQLGNSGGGGTVPTAISGGMTWSQLSAGQDTACGVTRDKELFCWGSNEKGQVGVNMTSPAYYAPQRVSVGTSYQKVFAGQFTFCGLGTDSTLSCWGENRYSLIGNSTYSTAVPAYAPKPVSGGHTFRTVAIGTTAACAIRNDASIWCWGQNDKGQYASTAVTSGDPVAAGTSNGQWTSIAAAGSSFCAIRTDGRLFCWGENPSVGALIGDGNASSKLNAGAVTSPREVAGGGTWTSIVGALGQTAFCGTQTGGQTKCWGQNFGAIPNASGNPTPMTSPLQAGGLAGIGLGMRNGYGIR